MDTKKTEAIKLVKYSHLFNMVIPEKVELKIRQACLLVPNIEWSGILFYSYTGKFEDKSLVIRCEDIYVMDIGNSGSTEFEMSPEVISYMSENPELLDCQLGLVHSHHNMSAFFSNTDLDTLLEEGKDRNHFVSLIVNNAGVYTAAITRKVTIKRTANDVIKYKTFEDNDVTETEVKIETKEFIHYFNLNIKVEQSSIDNTFFNRINEIKNKKNNTYKTYSSLDRTSDSKIKELELPFEKPDYNFSINRQNIKEEEENNPKFEPLIDIDDSVITSIIYQLLTGSIVITNKNNIDINKWVKGMKSLFTKRFGKGESGFKTFKVWADSYIEFLCWFSLEDKYPNYESDILASEVAERVIQKLEQFEKNEYIEEYINILTGYLL